MRPTPFFSLSMKQTCALTDDGKRCEESGLERQGVSPFTAFTLHTYSSPYC